VIQLCACFGLLMRIDDTRDRELARHFLGRYMRVWKRMSVRYLHLLGVYIEDTHLL
jgi:hypothetical protein